MAPASVPLEVGAVTAGWLSRRFSDRAEPSLQRRARKGTLENPARSVRELAAEAEAARPQPATERPSPKTARLPKRLQLVEQLPAADKRTVLKLVEAHAEAWRAAKPRARARAAS